MGHKVKVHIKGLPYTPRGKAGEYRAGSVQVLDAAEAYELDAAGIAIIVEDPCAEGASEPVVEAPVMEAPLPDNYGDGADAENGFEDEE